MPPSAAKVVLVTGVNGISGHAIVDDNSYAPSLADLSVWTTTQEHTANEAFNHANGDTCIWRSLFPRIASYFGLEVSQPSPTILTIDQQYLPAGPRDHRIRLQSRVRHDGALLVPPRRLGQRQVRYLGANLREIRRESASVCMRELVVL